MANDLEGSILAAGRRLKLAGTHSEYMQAYQDWPADQSAVAAAVKDLPHGSLCLDVGAHIGLTSLTIAALRPDCRVVAFEPLPQAQRCLRQNVSSNGIKNIELIEAAVGDVSSTISFDDHGPWSVATRGTSVLSKIVRLDDLELGSPAFIKIDVEGFEPNVLAGARALIAKARPLILMEFNSWTLLIHHYDVLTFAGAIWSTFDVLRMFAGERPLDPPPDPMGLVHMNLTQHGCVTDLLLRPKAAITDLHTMTDTPQAAELRSGSVGPSADYDSRFPEVT